MKKRPSTTPAHGLKEPPAPNSPLRQALAAVSMMDQHLLLAPAMPTSAMIEAAARQHNVSPALAAKLYLTMIDSHARDKHSCDVSATAQAN